MNSLSWPDRLKCEKLNNIIFKTGLDPFAVASYVIGENVTDFVGREKELAVFKRQIMVILEHGISRAVRLEGPAGVGKSTLFNYLKQSIEKERTEKKGFKNYISKKNDIFSAYFDVPDQILEFRDIWEPLMDSIRSNFEAELGLDLSLPEYVAFQLIFHLFKQNPRDIARIIWPDIDLNKNFSNVKLQEIINPIFDNAKIIIPEIQDYFRQKSRILRPSFKTKINSKLYKISRRDTSRIIKLFRVLDEMDKEDYLTSILEGSKSLFHNDDDLIRFFNDIMRYYSCCTKKQPILLIGIDEVAKRKFNAQEHYYKQFGSLFVKLRNNLHYTILVFISTTEDWKQYDDALRNNSDLRNQISEFMEKMVLIQLDVKELIQVFKNRMSRFWKNYSSNRSTIAPYYPFSPNTFIYVYRYKNRDLRESIIFLRNMLSDFRYYRRIPKLETIFENMREVRIIDSSELAAQSLRKFEWNIIRKEFEKPLRFRSNSSRSSTIEKGMESAWKILMNNSIKDITSVENNPNIVISDHSRRPDVLVRLLGNLGAELRRNIEFQIKAYGPNAHIDLKVIKSSIELFNFQYTDFIYFIITGKGFNSIAKKKIQEIEIKYPNRIRYPFLKPDQVRCLYFLAIFREITGHILGQEKNDEESARYCIESILGQTPENFLLEVKQLAYREPIVKTIIEPTIKTLAEPTIKTLAEPTIKTLVEPAIKPITEPTIRALAEPTIKNIAEPTIKNIAEPNEKISKIKQQIKLDQKNKLPLFSSKHKRLTDETSNWIAQYPNFKVYRFELCALCQYLQTRENSRYKNKFTKPTVTKNVIIPNAILTKKNFYEMVNELKNRGYLIKVKSSFKLTDVGLILYKTVKSTNFKC